MKVTPEEYVTPEQEKEMLKSIDFDPSGAAEPFDEVKMAEAIGHPDVKDVRVFKLRKGMRLSLGGSVYVVRNKKRNGRVTLELEK